MDGLTLHKEPEKIPFPAQLEFLSAPSLVIKKKLMPKHIFPNELIA